VNTSDYCGGPEAEERWADISLAQERAHGTTRPFISLHRGCQNRHKCVYRVILEGDRRGVSSGHDSFAYPMVCWRTCRYEPCHDVFVAQSSDAVMSGGSVRGSFVSIYTLYGNRFLSVSKAAHVSLGVYMIP
jgi:hypothetical protein